jgi:hypothetical protein
VKCGNANCFRNLNFKAQIAQEKIKMEWILLFILAILVAMGLLAGQQYVAPRFSQLQSLQANYAGNVFVTALFIFAALVIGGLVLNIVDKEDYPNSLPSA